MVILLDTHVLLWWDVSSPRLDEQARALTADALKREFEGVAHIPAS